MNGLDRLGRALADPIRRAVLVLLIDGTQRPSELALAIGTSRPNLSNHQACLRGCGMIEAQRSGRHQHYGLTSEQLADALRSPLAVAVALPACNNDQPSSAKAKAGQG